VRTLALATAVSLAACAQAGPPGSGDTDGPTGKDDAPTGSDAPLDIDSPVTVPDAMIDSAPVDTCASGQTCAAEASLGSVSGDTDFDMLTASGYQSAWYSVRVTEDDDGLFGIPLGFYVGLTSPASAHYQLFVYLDTDDDVVLCTGALSTTVSGTTESVTTEWGETGTFSNGDDDSRTISIEVRAPASGCDAGQPWSLTVYGDE
jgi:hypothetical protein